MVQGHTSVVKEFLTTHGLGSYTITLHIGNIFKEGELEVNSVRKESLLTAADGKNYRTKYYNLEVIISNRIAS